MGVKGLGFGTPQDFLPIYPAFYNCTLSDREQTVINQGGIQPGGLNFDAKVRRESVAVQDMFIAHIGW